MIGFAPIVGEAPGRLDFMGGVADYSGSLVLQTPTRCTTRVTLGGLAEDVVECHAAGKLEMERVPFGALRKALEAGADWAELWRLLGRMGAPHWTRYLLGSLLVFGRAKNWIPSGGLCFSVQSDVPQSLGVSSSAALEIATLRALAVFAGETFAGNEIAHLGQLAENHIVGAPCGLMDQLASAFGEAGKLLPILCRPDICRAPVPLPDGVCVVGWPSAVKHAVSGSSYGTARTASFMGKRILERAAGQSFRYTSEAALELFREIFGKDAIDVMRGGTFLNGHGGVDDPLSRVAPEREYPVRAATEFAIEENLRCETALSLLADCTSANRRDMLPQIGNLLYLSHHAYGRMGLGAPETDRMVEAIQRLGVENGFYGARISGGGSGGTVVVLCEKDALAAVAEIGRNVPGASSHLIF
jgi:L-arabinokinase